MDDQTRQAKAITLDGAPAAAALVDDDAMTSIALPARAVVGASFAAPVALSHYTLTGGARPPRQLAWTLEGRTGNGRWTVLDRRRAESFAWERQLRPFRIARPGAYAEYRLRFSGGAAFELAELELLTSGPAAPVAP
jgi:hypothetical protein